MPAKPRKPAFDVEEIREHIANVQHKAMDELSGELGILKKYLTSKRSPPAAAEGLDVLQRPGRGLENDSREDRGALEE